MKKKVLSLLLATAMVLTLAACNKTPAATTGDMEDQIVIGDWGGVWNEMAQTEVYAPFEATYKNTKIVSDFPGSSGAILAKLEAQKSNPQLDVALMTELMTIKAIRAGLLEEIDETKVPELKDVVDVAKICLLYTSGQPSAPPCRRFHQGIADGRPPRGR